MEINTNFQGKKIPKENASCKCLPLIMLDSAIRVSKKYHPQNYWKSANMKYKRLKWRILLMMI